MIRLVLALLFLAGCSTAPPLANATWNALDTGSDASLRGVCVLDDGVVWASGSSGTVLKSVDGGDTWQRFQVPGLGTADLRDIEATDANSAWVISITEPARILATNDGGVTWNVQYESARATSFFDSITLLEDGGGLVFGDPHDGVFEVLRSGDRRSWSPVSASALPRAGEGEAAFAASGTCIVSHGQQHAWIATGGTSARVLRSVDAGQSWSASATPLRQGEPTTGIYSVAFTDNLHGVIVGGDYTAPELAGDNAAFTTDGGVTWTAATTPPSGYRSCVAYLPHRHQALVAVGRAGCDVSGDGGATWCRLGQDSGFYAVAAAPDGTVIAVGSDGRAARLEIDR